MKWLRIGGAAALGLLLVASFIFEGVFRYILLMPAPLLVVLRLAAALTLILVYFKNVFLPARFFTAYTGVGLLFVSAFFVPQMLAVAEASLAAFGVLVVLDMFLLFNNLIKLQATRTTPKLLSLGDDNTIKLHIEHNFPLALRCTIIDELPDQLQRRDFALHEVVQSRTPVELSYEVRPTSRGEYWFHDIHCFIRSFLGLLERRITVPAQTMIPVYPSILQMKKYELLTVAKLSLTQGVKKIRRVGHGYEFEQIRNYVKGDDYRSINWKATSRRNSLMVNQYEDERSQQIFCVIDKGRSMKMPFEGLSLLDYAINATLVISNIALQRHDKAGLLTFSDKAGATVKAESGSGQLRLIIESLYNEQERNYEANFELFYTATKQFIRRRSLIFLYTNFESYSAMVRVLPLLRRVNRLHLLVVILFENTEILDYSLHPAGNTEEIYQRTIAARFVEEKQRMVQELTQYGIQSILTRPEDLSVNTVNKYLELKSRNMI